MRRVPPRCAAAMLASSLLLAALLALYYFAGAGEALRCYVCSAPDPVACPPHLASAAIKAKQCPGTDNVCLRVDVLVKASGAAASVRECLPVELGPEAAREMYSDAHVLVQRVHTCATDLCNGARSSSSAPHCALGLAVAAALARALATI